MKKIQLGSDARRFAQIRFEAYNVFNHAEWSGINLTPSFSPATGASRLDRRSAPSWCRAYCERYEHSLLPQIRSRIDPDLRGWPHGQKHW
jgi:hypothetical protein